MCIGAAECSGYWAAHLVTLDNQARTSANLQPLLQASLTLSASCEAVSWAERRVSETLPFTCRGRQHRRQQLNNTSWEATIIVVKVVEAFRQTGPLQLAWYARMYHWNVIGTICQLNATYPPLQGIDSSVPQRMHGN